MGGFINPAAQLYERLRDKARHGYDTGDAPFLIFLSVRGVLPDGEDISNAIYGRTAQLASSQLTRLNDGLFGYDTARAKGRHEHVSAVAVIRGFCPWEAEATEVAVYRNPYPVIRWPSEVFPCSREVSSI